MDETSFRSMVKLKFTKNIPQKTPPISKLPHSSIAMNISSPLSPCPTEEQLRKSKFQLIKKTKGNNSKTSVKLFAQVTATAKNILKTKEAFSALPKRKIIEIHNAVMNKPANRSKKIQITTKGPSKK